MSQALNFKDLAIPHFPRLRLVPFRTSPATFQMAADAYLFHHTTVPCFRLYGWEKPSLTFGKSTLKTFDLDLGYITTHEIPLAQRPTGGKTVFHDQEWTYAFIAPPKLFSSNILQTYAVLSQALLMALQIFLPNLSINPARKTNVTHTNCFGELASYEIGLEGRKIVGSAQARKNDALLQHGSILLNVDWPSWSHIWRTSEAKLQRKIISWQEMATPPALEDFQSSLEKVFTHYFQTQCYYEDFSAAELFAINETRPNFIFNPL